MKDVHFYKAKSRLGVTNFLHRQKDFNIGVEDAPDAVLTPNLLAQFPNHEVDKFIFPTPETVSEQNYYQVLADNLANFKTLINQTLAPGQIQVVVGGDNSVTFTSMLSLLERSSNQNQIGYIQFDSHGEMNLHKTSPTKNFHGMYLRPFIDHFDIPQINKLIKTKLPVENLLLIGNLDLDEEEKKFIQKSNIQTITKKEIVQNRTLALEKLVNFIANFDHLHINFDIDVFDSNEALATGIPTSNGLTEVEVFMFLEEIAKHPSLSIDSVEINPKKKGSKKTIQLAQKVLIKLMTF